MSEIDWDRPLQIPTVADPRRLPAGSGTLLMNEIARRAHAAGVPSLRYAGPYPTHALFASLLRSFRTNGTVEAFTADVLDRAARLARDEVAVDFVPAPFERRGDVDVRDGVVDRVRVDGVTYDREEQAGSLALLDDDRAILTVGVPIALIARLDGERIVEKHTIPAFPVPPGGFPEELVEQLAELAVDYVPAPLRDDVERKLRGIPVQWADLRDRSARRTHGRYELHVGFLALMTRDIAQFAERVSYHLATVAQQSVLDDLVVQRRQ